MALKHDFKRYYVWLLLTVSSFHSNHCFNNETSTGFDNHFPEHTESTVKHSKPARWEGSGCWVDCIENKTLKSQTIAGSLFGIKHPSQELYYCFILFDQGLSDLSESIELRSPTYFLKKGVGSGDPSLSLLMVTHLSFIALSLSLSLQMPLLPNAPSTSWWGNGSGSVLPVLLRFTMHSWVTPLHLLDHGVANQQGNNNNILTCLCESLRH